MTEATDRRIYIHKGSFETLARQGEKLSWLSSLALMNVRLAKIVHHHLEQGEELGLVRPGVAAVYASPIARARDESLTSLFTRVGYRPKLPYRPEPLLPVLQPDEKVVDTCFQDGYYTFATGAAAAARMFADRVPMPKLKNSIASGQGPHDLTIISGNNLAVMEQVPGDPLSIDQMREIDGWVRDIEPRLDSHVADISRRVGGFDPDEFNVIKSLSGAALRVMATASY